MTLRLLLTSLILAAAAPLTAGDRLVIDDFSSARPGTVPASWSPHKSLWGGAAKAPSVLTIKEENGNSYLAADSAGDSVTLSKPFRWNMKRYPVLSWRWRARKLPAGGNERKKKTNDSAAGVYVCFRGLSPLPYCLKYVWSASLPVGTSLPSPYRKASRILVLRSGPEGLGEWLEEKRDLAADYAKVFGRPPEKDPVGIAVLTDSDDTRSSAAADYDDFAVSGR